MDVSHLTQSQGTGTKYYDKCDKCDKCDNYDPLYATSADLALKCYQLRMMS